MSKRSPSFNDFMPYIKKAIECAITTDSQEDVIKKCKSLNPIELAIELCKEDKNSSRLDESIISNRIKRIFMQLLKNGDISINISNKFLNSPIFKKLEKELPLNEGDYLNAIKDNMLSNYGIEIEHRGSGKDVLKALSKKVLDLNTQNPNGKCFIYRGASLRRFANQFKSGVTSDKKINKKTSGEKNTSAFVPCIGQIQSVWKSPSRIDKEYSTASDSISAALTMAQYSESVLKNVECQTFDIPGLIPFHEGKISIEELRKYYESYPCYINTFSPEMLSKVHTAIFSVGNTPKSSDDEAKKFEENTVSWQNSFNDILNQKDYENRFTTQYLPEVLGRFYDANTLEPLGDFVPETPCKTSKNIISEFTNFYYRILGLNHKHCMAISDSCNRKKAGIPLLGSTILCLHRDKVKSVAAAILNNKPRFVNTVYIQTSLLIELDKQINEVLEYRAKHQSAKR